MTVVTLYASHTHLFRGARLTTDGEWPTEPTGVRLVMRDEVEVDAELWAESHEPGLVLAVPVHHTGAGTTIPAKVWPIARIEAAGDDGAVAVLGQPIPR